MKRKHDVQALVVIAGSQLQQLGVILAEDEEVEKDIQGLDWMEAELTSAGDSEIFEVLGIGLLGLAKSMSRDGSRGGVGAYDAIPKSKDFFNVSLQWPDRWFCSRYRYLFGLRIASGINYKELHQVEPEHLSPYLSNATSYGDLPVPWSASTKTSGVSVCMLFGKIWHARL